MAGIVAGGGNDTRCLFLFRGSDSIVPRTSLLAFRKIIHQFPVVEFTIPSIYLRNLGFQVGKIAFREAAHHIEAFQAPLSLTLQLFQDGIDALFLGIGNEATGVYHHYLALRVVAIMGNTKAMSLEKSHQLLRIHQILRAPK